MSTITQIINSEFKQAIATALGDVFSNVDPLIQVAVAPHFGDYQANFALRLAKELQTRPQIIAQKVADQLLNNPHFSQVLVSGPGFINVQLADKFLQDKLRVMLQDPQLGVETIKTADLTIVEYGGPNVAKEMHVGHLRSAVIGDALARILTFLGHRVLRQNHIGDWGTQFGMLIEYILSNKIDLTQEAKISDANVLYQQAKICFDKDPEFAKRARERVVALQAGDPEILSIWKKLVAKSEEHFQEIYTRLQVLLQNEDVRGESFYNPMLAQIVNELVQKGLATESQGAQVIFLPGFVDPENNPLPLIIQKSDGGYLYATTDLAALKYRIETLQARRIVYVVDARQAQHFAMVFAAAERAGWLSAGTRVEHAGFGAMLGKDRKPFKTRSGESVKLLDLLNEAEQRALAVIEGREIASEQRNKIARIVGIGALKYADLCADKIKDYVFDWDKMLSFEGNTAPYLQNAYVRICSIFRKNQGEKDLAAELILSAEIEHALVLHLLRFPELIYKVGEELAPHRLCTYLYELAAMFHKFYEQCPVLTAQNSELKNSRLILCELTARCLAQGLNLLGIEVLEQM